MVYVPEVAAPAGAARPRGQRRRGGRCSRGRSTSARARSRASSSARGRPPTTSAASSSAVGRVPRQSRDDRHPARGRRRLDHVAVRGDPAARHGHLRADARPEAGALLVRSAMSVPLESLATCFQGLLPAQLFTCSRGRHAERRVPEPRRLRRSDARGAVVPVLQQEPPQHRREPARAGASCSIPTRAGLAPAAALRAIGDRADRCSSAWRCASRRSRPYCGLKGIFKLRAADVYEVARRRAGGRGDGHPRSQTRTPRPRRPPARSSR